MSDTKKDLDILIQAQLIDGELYRKKLELEDVPVQREKIQDELNQEKTRLNELEETLKQLKLKQKEKEGLLAEKEQNVLKLDGQLSQVKTNKEYAALQQEIASLKADNSLLEEEIIKFLDEIDAAQAAVKEEQGRFMECEKKSKAREEELQKAEKEISASIAELEGKRSEIVKELSAEVKGLYERILAKKQGLAVVKVANETCPACQMRLRPQVINELMMAQTLILCENCSRIMYSVKED